MAVWVDKFINPNQYSRPQTKLTAVKKVVIHWTANLGASASNHFTYFNNLKDRYASAHFFVDKVESLCIIPLNEISYHANDGTYRGVEALKPNANFLSVGIEMCVEKDGTFHSETIRRAEEVALELCNRYGLNPLTDIVRHYDITHKNCPAPWVSNGQAFVDFKNRVNAKKNGSTPAPSTPFTYPTGSLGKVTITADALNVRDNYNLESSVVGQVTKGQVYPVFKIVDEFYLIDTGKWISNRGGKYATYEVKPVVVTPTPTPTPTNVYRIRKTWEDTKSQIGAYGNLDSAKALADSNAGYNVYDENGTLVYPIPVQQPAPTPTNLYRVRLTWEDAKSQIGAYGNLDSAKALVDANREHKVFDSNGNIVYEIVIPTPAPTPVEHLYRVRKSWEDVDSQLGAYKELEGAKSVADVHAGYKVFNETGALVYEPVVKEQPEPVQEPVTPPVVQPEPVPTPVEEPVAVEPEPVPVDLHEGHHDILGESTVAVEKMIAFVKEKNPNALFIEEIAKQFIEVGKTYGIRGDMAFCQSLIETGWFKFDGGTAVTPDQHNYCGLGVTSKGMKGNSFTTVKDGVTAQLQHLFAYASKNELPNGEILLDPRFKYVTREIAPHWEDLSNRWAMNANYGTHIVALYEQLVNYVYVPPVVEEPVQPEPVQEPQPELPPVPTEEEKAISIGKKIVDYLIEQLKKIFKL
jgi:N-acetylmuramoyl-L-alanine amidase